MGIAGFLVVPDVVHQHIGFRYRDLRQPELLLQPGHSCPQGVVLQHEIHACRHAFSMQPGIQPPGSFHGVADGVPEVQQCPTPLFLFVFLYDHPLEIHTPGNDFIHRQRILLEEIHQPGIQDQAHFQGLRQTCGNLPVIERGEDIRVNDHGLRLPECANDVFQRPQVHGCLPAYRGIHLGEYSGGDVVEVDAPHVDRCAESRQVSADPATDSHHGVFTRHAGFGHLFEHLLHRSQVLGSLAMGNRHHEGTRKSVLHRIHPFGGNPVICDDARVPMDGNPLAGGCQRSAFYIYRVSMPRKVYVQFHVIHLVRIIS